MTHQDLWAPPWQRRCPWTSSLPSACHLPRTCRDATSWPACDTPSGFPSFWLSCNTMMNHEFYFLDFACGGPGTKKTGQPPALESQEVIIIIIIIIHVIIIISGGYNNNRIQRCNLKFCTVPSLCREQSPTCTLKWPRCDRVQITCNRSSPYHVQHVLLHAMWYKWVAQLLNLTEFEIAFLFING